MKNKLLRGGFVLALGLLMLTVTALASGDHDCVDDDLDHFCDVCWESITVHCLDEDGDHCCDVCYRQVRDQCADGDGDEHCDLCFAHLPEFCVDADKNHICDVCWAALSNCTDENKDHLCDRCGGVFWVDADADGECDGCDAVLTHVVAHHIGVYYYERNGATLADVAIRVTVMPYKGDAGCPAGTVSVRWTDADGNSYATVDAALTFGETTAVVEFPGLPLSALHAGGRVSFTPYDAGFTPAENGCVIEYDLPALRVDSDSEFTVNGVSEHELYVSPGTQVVVKLQPGLTESFEWVYESNSARPDMTTDGLTVTFPMPETDVNMHAAWRCETCTDADGDEWCDVCEYYVEHTVAADVQPGQWYTAAVNTVVEEGLMTLAAEDTFAPHAAATRADFLRALWVIEGAPVVNYLMTFTDVSQQADYAEAVRWAAAMGIAQGYPDGAFRPEEAISRQEMAVFLYRYIQNHGDGFAGMWMFLLDCTDRDQVAAWAYEALCWLTMNGMMQGDGTGALDPQGIATRAQMAQLLSNYM